MHALVHSAELPFISCFAPHIASLTSPVKVWLLPAASAGTAAIPANNCIPRTAATIRFAFIFLWSPVKRVKSLVAPASGPVSCEGGARPDQKSVVEGKRVKIGGR